MNILISAYACEPNKGSEPGVGWNWAVTTARHHSVWVITRDNNRQAITSYLLEHPELDHLRLHFIYVGLPKKLTFWKKGRRGMRLFYLLWQRKAAKVAAVWNRSVHFDLVHSITFVSFTQTTYMYRLRIPMIWGPVAGGDNIPKTCSRNLEPKEKFTELLRRVSQQLALLTPSIRKTMKYSSYLFAATEATKELLPLKYRDKTTVLPAIGIEAVPILPIAKREEGKLRVVMAGNLNYLKAVDLGIKAFLRLAENYPEIELHILGQGNKKAYLKKLSGTYLNQRIFFDPPVPHDQITDYYSSMDICITTALRDSGCMTMLEAMSVGLPCICLANGGPKLLGSDTPELMVEPTSRIVQEISDRLKKLVYDKELRIVMGRKAHEAAMKYLYDRKCLVMEPYYKECVRRK